MLQRDVLINIMEDMLLVSKEVSSAVPPKGRLWMWEAELQTSSSDHQVWSYSVTMDHHIAPRNQLVPWGSLNVELEGSLA